MDGRLLVYFILTRCISQALPFDDEEKGSGSIFTLNYEDGYETVLPDSEINKSLKPATGKPITTYEVTEIVNDIPDDGTIGPIHTNYTTQRPLNVVSDVFRNENSPIYVEDNNEKNNHITFLHVKADYDNKDKRNEDNFDLAKVPQLFGIKGYLRGIKRGVIRGLNSIIHSNRYPHNLHFEDNDDLEPLSFFRQIQKKSSDVSNTFRNGLLGKKFDDIFNY